MTHLLGCPGRCYAHLVYNATPSKPNGPFGHDVIHLHEQVVSIGREKCTVILDSEDMPTTLSRKHAVLSLSPSTPHTVELKDTSTNGTKVNGVKINSHTLREGDVITFGVSDVVYVFKELPALIHTNGPTDSPSTVLQSTTNQTELGSKNGTPSAQANNCDDQLTTVNKLPKDVNTTNNVNVNINSSSNNNTNNNSNTNNTSIKNSKNTNTNQSHTNRPGDHKHKLDEDEDNVNFNISFESKINKKQRTTEKVVLEPTLAKMHQQIYKVGEKVEAKCQKASSPEFNAWFEATIIHFNPENDLYTIKFEGYTDFYNESLPVSCLRGPSNGDWKWSDINVGDIIIASYKGWWYDARVTKKLGPFSKTSKKPLLHAKLRDLPDVEVKCLYDDVYLPVPKT